jgi:hypothetical protein
MTLAAGQTGSIQLTLTLDGLSVNVGIAPAGNTVSRPSATLPAALASSGNWTRSSATVATSVTFTAHGLAGTELVALFWDGGYVYDCTVTVVNPNTLTITVPGGQTALPAANTPLLLAVAQDVTNSVSIVGSNLQQLLITSTQPGLCELLDSGPTQRRLSVLTAAAPADYWPTAAGQAVPFSQTVVKARMYNNSQTAAVMTAAALLA